MKLRFIGCLQLFLVCFLTIQNVQARSEISPSEARENISESLLKKKDMMLKLKEMPNYWMRIINILTKGLDVCDLVGVDKISFVEDINAVMKSPINNQSALERIRFLRVIKRAKTHDAFLDIKKSQDDFDKLQDYVESLIDRKDYFEAISQLLATEKITERRGTEIVSYLSYLAYEDNLSDNDKDALRKLIYVAIDAMPAYQEQLENLLKLLNRKPEVITRIIEKEVKTDADEMFKTYEIHDPSRQGRRRSGRITIRKSRDRLEVSPSRGRRDRKEIYDVSDNRGEMQRVRNDSRNSRSRGSSDRSSRSSRSREGSNRDERSSRRGRGSRDENM